MSEKPNRWICDECGKVIEKAEDGWVEWQTENNHHQNFRIVHHVSASPLEKVKDGRTAGCYSSEKFTSSYHLSYLTIEPAAIASLLGLLHLPTECGGEENNLRVKSVEEWTELCRRLLIKDYDFAMVHWAKAKDDGLLTGSNENAMYSQSTIEEIIKEYEQGQSSE